MHRVCNGCHNKVTEEPTLGDAVYGGFRCPICKEFLVISKEDARDMTDDLVREVDQLQEEVSKLRSLTTPLQTY